MLSFAVTHPNSLPSIRLLWLISHSIFVTHVFSHIDYYFSSDYHESIPGLYPLSFTFNVPNYYVECYCGQSVAVKGFLNHHFTFMNCFTFNIITTIYYKVKPVCSSFLCSYLHYFSSILSYLLGEAAICTCIVSILLFLWLCVLKFYYRVS